VAATKHRYTKDDVCTHAEGYYGPQHPAVNVKIYTAPNSVTLPLELGSSYPAGHPELIEHHRTDERFTHAWLEDLAANDPDMCNAIWEQACEDGFEQASELATDIFGPFVKTWAEGRSGGWLVVVGLPPVEEWDAVALGRWRKFERICTLIKNDVPRMYVESVYMNVWEVDNDGT
jgi:hypothetical protein